jgi:anaerobic magnesium-protoporphyrin IX monomethyl ester cyclase
VKFLLIKPPTVHFKHTAPPVSGLPLGILYIAAAVQKAGHDVQVYDAIVGAAEARWGFPERDGALRMGASWDEIEQAVRRHSPDVVCISNQFSSQAAYALRTAESVKRVNSSIKVVIGGPHATVMASSFLFKDSPVDFAVLGEGEQTVPELAESIAGRRDQRTVAGIAYMGNGQLVSNPRREFFGDLDQLPLPAYELVDLERYFYFNAKGKDGRESYRYPGSDRSVSVITSRGCPFRCIFCSIQLVMGQKFRAHSVESVRTHLRLLKDKYGVRHIHFEDDNISFDMARFRDILDGMIADKLDMTWDTPNGVRADFLDEEILRTCKASGCTYLRIGVESADEEVSKNIIRKHLDTGRIIDIARLCDKIGIDLEAFYIIGFPGEKIPQMKKTVRFALSQARAYGMYPYDLFTATPLIGTELYRQAREKGYLTKDLSSENLAQATQGEGMICTEDFSPADLKGLLKNFRLRRNLAMALFFARFLLRHPGYIRRQAGLLLRLRLNDFIKGFLMFRYRNCVLRGVGEL